MIVKKISKENKQSILRIAHYNIFNGGEGKLEKILKVIQKIDPDVCGVLEAVGWQNKKNTLKSITKKLGYKFFNIAIANSKYNIGFFSKVPVVVKYIKKGFRHVVVQIIIKEGKHRGLNVFFVHLSPVSEDERMKEVEKLLLYINKYSRSIVMGDFNSLSLHDPYNEKKLMAFFKKNNITKYGINKLRFDVIKKIESSGLVDVMRHLKRPFIFSVPTQSNADINHTLKLRVDYAFVTKKVLKHFSKAQMFKNYISDTASDHYPFFIELK